MLKISRLADYGIVLMSNIARETTRETFAARDLAGESNLPLPMASKVLKGLSRAGLLVSHRGVNGGYSLGRDPATITVVDIIAALDGPIALTSCCEQSISECEIESCCHTKTNWQLINQSVVSSLGNITLAEMAGSLSSRDVTAAGK